MYTYAVAMGWILMRLFMCAWMDGCGQPSMSQETVESTFDRFLTEFPLCFGYWNKVGRIVFALYIVLSGDIFAHSVLLLFASVCNAVCSMRNTNMRWASRWMPRERLSWTQRPRRRKRAKSTSAGSSPCATAWICG